MSEFLQSAPRLPDAWTSDSTLREAVSWHLGPELFAGAQNDLAVMGRIASAPETLAMAMKAEAEPPVHVPYSAWGERIDEINVSEAYLELGRIGVRAGVTALPYEETIFGDKARIVWAALLALWGPSSALYSCPVAMTDGAARTLLENGSIDDVEIVGRLTARDPGHAWTSGQWMTETSGGSDLSRTGTTAERADDHTWRLYGTKWFTSATTAEMALTLARPEGAREGARGLALFRIHRLLDDGSRNAIVVRRLKDKLGTRTIPTAELELAGAIAHPIGDPFDGGGIRRISSMLNITRLHNAIGSAAALARGLSWARAYAGVREVLSTPLIDLPAHRTTVAELAVDYAAAMSLSLRCAELLGRVEHGSASDDERVLLRALIPVTKLATARWAVAGVSEAMEAIGGVGYCEDSGIPALVRNTHVLPIWEGTTNVLALDLMRAGQTGGSEALVDEIERTAARTARVDALATASEGVAAAARMLATKAAEMQSEPDGGEAFARTYALGIANTCACSRLLLQAAETGGVRPALVAARLVARNLLPPGPPADGSLAVEPDPEPAGESAAYSE